VISSHEWPGHRVSVTCAAGRTQLSIDGHEVRSCRGAVLTLDENWAPKLELTLAVLSEVMTDLPAMVMLDESTAAALKAMGWRPPPGNLPEGDTAL
jgi:hypothetical protein